MTTWKLRFVAIDCPIKHWNHPLVQEMFHKIINLKLTGFHSKMPDNYLPIDTTDYIGTHIVACKENKNGSLHPIMGFKGITLERCLHYGQNFSGRGCISSVHSDIHKTALDQYINQSISEGHALAYASSFAIDPDLKGREKFEAIKLLFPLLLFYHREFKFPRLIACGATRTKTHITFQKLGFHPLSQAGKVLSAINNPALQNEEVVVMALENFSAECEASANDNQDLWDNRIQIADRPMESFVTLPPNFAQVHVAP